MTKSVEILRLGRIPFYSVNPPANEAVILIAELMTAKEECKLNPTHNSFIRYQEALSNLLNNEECRYVIAEVIRGYRPIAGD